MSSTTLGRSIVSVFLVGHLAALTISAIPSPADLKRSEGIRESPDDATSIWVRPTLDWAASVLDSFAGGAWQATRFARPLAGPYVGRLGLVQNWSMFANPPRGSEYLRFRYYSEPRAPGQNREMSLVTELVFPIAPQSESHLIRAYWQAHRDKAISNALVSYFRLRLDRREGGLPTPSVDEPAIDHMLASSFIPVVRFFSSRYANTHSSAAERLVRTEAWYGFAASRPRGDMPVSPKARTAAIARYYGGPASVSVPTPVFAHIDSIEREADLLWMLIYVQGQ